MWSCCFRFLLAFEPITKVNRFKLHPDGVHDGNHGSCLEFKSRQHRAELMNRQRIVAVQQHIPAPVAHANNEHLDLEILVAQRREPPSARLIVRQYRSRDDAQIAAFLWPSLAISSWP